MQVNVPGWSPLGNPAPIQDPFLQIKSASIGGYAPNLTFGCKFMQHQMHPFRTNPVQAASLRRDPLEISIGGIKAGQC